MVNCTWYFILFLVEAQFRLHKNHRPLVFFIIFTHILDSEWNDECILQ